MSVQAINEIKMHLQAIRELQSANNLVYVGCANDTGKIINKVEETFRNRALTSDTWPIVDIANRAKTGILDVDITKLGSSAGVYSHHSHHSPTRNDGAYGVIDGVGIMAATGHDELYFRAVGETDWATDTVQDSWVVDNPEDENLAAGVYAVRMGNMGENGPRVENLPGRSPETTYGILHIDDNDVRRLYHAYYGSRAWQMSAE